MESFWNYAYFVTTVIAVVLTVKYVCKVLTAKYKSGASSVDEDFPEQGKFGQWWRMRDIDVFKREQQQQQEQDDINK